MSHTWQVIQVNSQVHWLYIVLFSFWGMFYKYKLDQAIRITSVTIKLSQFYSFIDVSFKTVLYGEKKTFWAVGEFFLALPRAATRKNLEKRLSCDLPRCKIHSLCCPLKVTTEVNISRFNSLKKNGCCVLEQGVCL